MHTDMGVRSALLLGLLSVFGISVAEQLSDVSTQDPLPLFCGTKECPRYKLVKQYDNFEHRVYEYGHWVTTSLEDDVFGIGMVISFRRLFKYISGKNAEELKMNMTVPVVMYIPLQQPPAGNSTMSYFIPHEVKHPPKPTDPAVYHEAVPAETVYVKTFGGYAFSHTYAKQAKALAEELRTNGVQFEDSYFVRAVYNDPFTLFNRHNEVWYLEK